MADVAESDSASIRSDSASTVHEADNASVSSEDASAHSDVDAKEDMAKWTRDEWASKMVADSVGFQFSFEGAVEPVEQVTMPAVPAAVQQGDAGGAGDSDEEATDDFDMSEVLAAARLTLAPAFCKSDGVNTEGVSETIAEWRGKRNLWKSAVSGRRRAPADAPGGKRKRTS